MASTDPLGSTSGYTEMMKYDSIAEIFSANERIRERLLAVLRDTTAAERCVRPVDGGWSLEEIVDHLALVEDGTLRICTRLLIGAKADGKLADGRVELNPLFGERSTQIAAMKVQAPDRVKPTGERSLNDSIDKLKQLRSQITDLRGDLETYDLTDHRFPHPFMGDLTAAEWLIVLGGHEARHTKQIERHISALRSEKSPGQKEGDPTGEKLSGNI